MKDVEHGDGGSRSRDDDRRQIDGEAENDQHDSRAHGPQDRMFQDPVTEPAPKTAHLLVQPDGRLRAVQSGDHVCVSESGLRTCSAASMLRS
jgi:hypothetical protein